MWWSKKLDIEEPKSERDFRRLHLDADDNLRLDFAYQGLQLKKFEYLMGKAGVEKEQGVRNMAVETGDVVWLKSACKSCEADFNSGFDMVAPKMTVIKIDDGSAKTIRWNGKEYINEEFPVVALHVAFKGGEFNK